MTNNLIEQTRDVRGRKQRARTQTFSLEGCDYSDPVKRLYRMVGSGTSSYTITISNTHTCSCPDHSNNGHRCKHIYHVLFDVYNAEDFSDIICLSDEQRDTLFALSTEEDFNEKYLLEDFIMYGDTDPIVTHITLGERGSALVITDGDYADDDGDSDSDSDTIPINISIRLRPPTRRRHDRPRRSRRQSIPRITTGLISPFQRRGRKRSRKEMESPVVKRKEEKDADCCICFESMINEETKEIDENTTWYCMKGCGQSVHKNCFAKYTVSNASRNFRKKCVLCRAAWKTQI